MKLLIELPNWMGDTIMSTPAIYNLLDVYEDPKLTIIGSKVSIDLLKNLKFVEKTVVVNSKSFSLYRKISNLGNFDVFISFRGSLGSKLIKLFVSSKTKYQFNKKKFSKGHLVERYSDFVNKSLNIESSPGKLIIHYESNNLNKTRKVLGVNPGASYGSAKRWSPKKFAEVAIKLSSEFDIIIFGGPAEQDFADQIEYELLRFKIRNYINLAGKTSISDLVNNITKLDLFITGDSGPMHLAAALKIPTVAIFGPTDEKETSQWMNEKSSIVKKDLHCRPCLKRTCPLKHHNCMKNINASDVLQAIKDLN